MSSVFVMAMSIPTTKKINADELTVNFSVEIGAASTDPSVRTSPKILSSIRRSFQMPLHADDGQLRRLITASINTLEIPFLNPPADKTILWGTLAFPDGQNSTFETLDEIKSRLCHVARTCVATCYMHVVIRKVDRVSVEDYRKLLDGGGGGEGQQPLSGWIKENSNDVNLNRVMELLHQLCHHAPADNKYFGLRSVRVEEEQEGCSICLKGLKKGSEVIRMPCSHMFHGFCIFRWIPVNSSCPVCRSDLKIDRRLLLQID